MNYPKRIQALVDYPNSGGVKKGEIGIYTGISNEYDFPSQKNYNVVLNKAKYKILDEIEIQTKSQNMKYNFKTGDGITWKTVRSVEQRKEIYKLIREKGYPLYREYRDCSKEYTWGYNEFANNFYFNRQGKWCTASVSAVTNPMSFEQIKNLIENGGELNYEIY